MRKLPDNIGNIAGNTLKAVQLAEEIGGLPQAYEPALAWMYVGTQAVMGACDRFGIERPISGAEYAKIRAFTASTLAPYQFSSPTAEAYNNGLKVEELGDPTYFTLDGDTYFDTACKGVATQRYPEIPHIGLVVENSRLGRPNGGFVADRQRFPRNGPLSEIFDRTTGGTVHQTFARRVGHAVSRAAYDAYHLGGDREVRSSRFMGHAIKELALAYSVQVVAHGHAASRRNGSSLFVPSPVEAYHIARIGQIIASRGEAGHYRNEISPVLLRHATKIVSNWGQYGQRDAGNILSDSTPIKDDIRQAVHAIDTQTPIRWDPSKLEPVTDPLGVF